MWPLPKYQYSPATSSPLPVARPYTPPSHGEDVDPFSDQGYFSNPFGSPPASNPIHNALFSCLGHFEHLIQTSEPSDEQMEQILSNFEEMASILSAPQSQSRESADHLFGPELDLDQVAPDLGDSLASIKSSPQRMQDSGYTLNDSGYNLNDSGYASFSEAHIPTYIKAVQNYIDGVQDSTKGLKARMAEIKELNEIQGEIITELRQQLRKAKAKAASSPRQKEKTHVIRNPERNGFWSAIGEALDQFGEMLNEW
jgi:hypothetical protein